MSPVVTVAIPSYNQGRFLEQALESVFQQDLATEVFVADGGSTDNSVDVIRRFESRLTGWRSYSDRGQAAAINECISNGNAPYVCWLNSDDCLLEGALRRLVDTLERRTGTPAAYGKVWSRVNLSGNEKPIFVEPFSEHRLAQRCIISQPGTLMTRAAWEAVSGVDENLNMAMDYDLWWRLYKKFGALIFLNEFVAVSRDHAETKTNLHRQLHYDEAIRIVREHYGRVPLRWWLAQPYSVWLKSIANRLHKSRRIQSDFGT
jgi:glycosyltransferase involved in cell wall biosynthesis